MIATRKKAQREECRIRIYGDYETHDPAKWRLVAQQLQRKLPEPEAPGDDIDMEGGNFKDDLPATRPRRAQPLSSAQKPKLTFDDDN